MIGVRWYFVVVLIGISPVRNDIKHLFMCLFAICVSLVSCLFKSLATFFNLVACFLIVEVLEFFVCFGTSPLQDLLPKSESYPQMFLFIMLTTFSVEDEFLILMKYKLAIFFFHGLSF